VIIVTYTIIHTTHTIALLIVIAVALAAATVNIILLAVAAVIHLVIAELKGIQVLYDRNKHLLYENMSGTRVNEFATYVNRV
jgi:hypothetical protein